MSTCTEILQRLMRPGRLHHAAVPKFADRIACAEEAGMPKSSRPKRRLVALLALSAVAGTLPMFLLEPVQAMEPEAVIEVGRAEFHQSCASCHGEDGRGDGPISGVLSAAPADLTQLEKNFDGSFPRQYVYETIDGRFGAHAHGPRDMPAWGSRYTANDWARRRSDHGWFDERAMVFGRINALTAYIESIQE